jgi:hypothetical protein
MDELEDMAARVIPWLWPKMWQPGQKCEEHEARARQERIGHFECSHRWLREHDIPCPPWTAELMERALKEVERRWCSVCTITYGELFDPEPLCEVVIHTLTINRVSYRATDPEPRFAVLRALAKVLSHEKT